MKWLQQDLIPFNLTIPTGIMLEVHLKILMAIELFYRTQLGNCKPIIIKLTQSRFVD